LMIATLPMVAAPAIEVLGKDYTFPNKIEEFPSKLSEFTGLQINSFRTSDGVRLTYPCKRHPMIPTRRSAVIGPGVLTGLMTRWDRMLSGENPNRRPWPILCK